MFYVHKRSRRNAECFFTNIFLGLFDKCMYIYISILILIVFDNLAEQIRVLIEQQEKLYERKAELNEMLEACKASGSTVKDGVPSAAENWSGQFEWDSLADDVRFNIFGISTYRANQREVSVFQSQFIHRFAFLFTWW